MAATPGLVDLHCSAVTRELGEPAPGSAGTMTHVVLVELPMPWPKNIEDHPLLVGADLSGKKLFGIATTRPATEMHAVISYRAIGAGSTDFHRAERSAPTAEVADFVSATDTWSHQVPTTGDLLVCTHGTHDRCCGQYGTLLHGEVLAQAPTPPTCGVPATLAATGLPPPY
ncbi:MAG: sucrase ferredoxin [Acidimicrobiales bacterium]